MRDKDRVQWLNTNRMLLDKAEKELDNTKGLWKRRQVKNRIAFYKKRVLEDEAKLKLEK